MLDREKVIKAIECRKNADKRCGNPCEETGMCHYAMAVRGLDGEIYKPFVCDRERICTDAVALLKEQEHSETFIVIDTKTGKEADEYEIALHEDWAKHLCYCDMDGWAIMDNGSLLLVDECGKFAYADRERFKVKWE